MKKLIVLFAVLLTASIYGGVPPSPFSKSGAVTFNATGDSLYFIVYDGANYDTIFFSMAGMYWEPATVLDSSMLDSIHDGLGRFAGGGTGWDWEDSSGQVPFWVDSSTYATVSDSAFKIDTTATGFTTYISNHAGTGQWTSVGGDSALQWYAASDTGIEIRASNETTYISSGDNTVLVIGDEGSTTIDSVRVLGRVVFLTASDSIVFPLSNPIDNYILVYDASGDSLAWEAQSGGWNFEDSLLQVQLEIEDSLDEVWADLAEFDTNYVQLTVGGQLLLADSSIASEGELEDSLDGYLNLAGGTMTGSILGIDSLDIDSGVYISDDITVTGKVVTDSIQGGTGTPKIIFDGDGGGTDLDSIRWDSILYDIRNPGGGGSGTTDSFYILDSLTYPDEGWYFGDDTLPFDTTQRLALQDTADFHIVIDSQIEVLIGDSLTEVWTNLNEFDTNYVQLTVGGQLLLADSSIASEGELEDSLDSYLLTATASSTYETIAEVAKIGDDTTSFKLAADSVAAWDNGGLDSTHFGNATIGWEDLDTAGQSISHLGQTIDSTEIPDASVAWNDIDTTGSGIVQGAITLTDVNAYIDTTTLDTIRHALIADTARFTNNQSNDYISGFLTVRTFEHLNVEHNLDMTELHAVPADTFLRLKVYDDAILDNQDTFQIMHTTSAYFPGGFPKDRYIQYNEFLAGTPLTSGGTYENFSLFAWNDSLGVYEDTFLIDTSVAATYDTIRNSNPVVSISYWSDGVYMSDPFIGPGKDGDLYALLRVTIQPSGGDALFRIYAMHSPDGITWSDTNLLIDGSYRTFGDTSSLGLQAPSFIIGENGTYQIYAEVDTGANPTCIGIWETQDLMDGQASIGRGIDTFTFGVDKEVTFSIVNWDMPGALLFYHAMVSQVTPDIILGLGQNSSQGDSMFAFISRDGGYTFTDPFVLFRQTHAGPEDTTRVYTLTGHPAYDNGRFYFKGFLSAPFDSGSGVQDRWGTYLCPIYFGADDYEYATANIWNPDGINDTVIFFHADTVKYPNGVVIEDIEMYVHPSATYSLPVLLYNGSLAIADTITTLSTSSATRDNVWYEDLNDGARTIPPDYYVQLNIPATDIQQLYVRIKFYAR